MENIYSYSPLNIRTDANILGNATTTGRLVIGTTAGRTNDFANLWVSGNIYNEGSATTTGILTVSQYATTTGGLFTQGSGHFGGGLTVDANSAFGSASDANINLLVTSTDNTIDATGQTALKIYKRFTALDLNSQTFNSGAEIEVQDTGDMGSGGFGDADNTMYGLKVNASHTGITNDGGAQLASSDKNIYGVYAKSEISGAATGGSARKNVGLYGWATSTDEGTGNNNFGVMGVASGHGSGHVGGIFLAGEATNNSYGIFAATTTDELNYSLISTLITGSYAGVFAGKTTFLFDDMALAGYNDNEIKFDIMHSALDGDHTRYSLAHQSNNKDLWLYGYDGSTQNNFLKLNFGSNVTGIGNGTSLGMEMALVVDPSGTPQTSGGSMDDGTYYYVVTAVDANGGQTIAGTESPGVTIAGGGGSGSVDLTWSEVTGAKSYLIYRSTTSGVYEEPCYIDQVFSTTYTDTANAPPGGSTPPTTNSAYYTYFSATGNSWMNLNGYLGVGTTSPPAKLSVFSGNNTDNLLQVATSTNPDIFVIDSQGRLGVNTSTPNTALHVVLGSGAGGHPAWDERRDVAVFESNDNAAIQILAPSDKLSLLGFSNPSSRHAGVISYDHASKKFYMINAAYDGDTSVLTISPDGYAFGTTSPSYAYFQIHSTTPSYVASDPLFAITTSTSEAGAVDIKFKVMPNGAVYADDSYYNTGADYAEYFYTADTDLTAGEAVCIDLLHSNAVRRCTQSGDTNIMGIVSSRPALIGNAREENLNNKNYVIVAMLGQIPAKVSAENGAIRPGDSLSAAALPGYVRKADAGDSTVGVALESWENGQGTIQVMISRRNKSLTVEEVEKQVTTHIAEMEIEDEVQLLVQDAVKNYDLASEVKSIVDPSLAILDAKFTLSVSEQNDKIAGLNAETIQNSAAIKDLQNNVYGYALASSTETLLAAVGMLEENASSTNNAVNIIQGQILDLQNQASTTASQLAVLMAATSTSPLAVSNVDVNANYLSVQQAATFFGTITVKGETGFEYKVTFYQDIEVKGKIYASRDQAGTVTLKANTLFTDVVFEQEYLIIPKVVANLSDSDDSTFVNFKVARKTPQGFTLMLQNPIGKDLTFDWIALAVKSDPPVINNIITSVDPVTASSTVNLQAEVMDPDTASAELKYVWEFSPLIGTVSGETNAISWTLPGDAITADTDVTVKLTVTDGGSVVAQEKIIKVLAVTPESGSVAGAETGPEEPPAEAPPVETTEPPAAEPDPVLGCMDAAAVNYNPAATQDDGSCTY